MAAIESSFLQLGELDRLSGQDTPVHRLDPRAKVLTTIAFLVAVVSFGKYELARLVPFAVFPVAVAAAGNVPARFLVRKVAAVAPFALLVGIFNPLLDREVLLRVGPLAVTGGWLSFASLLARVALTVSAAFILIATSSFEGVCMGLERLGVPKVFAMQLLFLYRYVFVLGDQAARMVRARALRSFGQRGLELRVFGSMVGHLLLRTLDRAERVHLAMLCRGFTGEIRLLKQSTPGWREAAFVAGWCSAFALLRAYDLPLLLGRAATGLAS